MWNILYTFRTGDYHFRKQAPIGPYYADFACHHARLVIEVDGETHGTELERQHDARRDAFLRRQGYTVLRFTNIEIAESPDGVHDAIIAILKGRPKNVRSSRGATPSPTLPTKGGGARPALGGALCSSPSSSDGEHDR